MENQPRISPTPRSGAEGLSVSTLLSDWYKAFDRAMHSARPDDAARVAKVVLQHMPRHLGMYARLLQLTWTLKRWDEGDEWGRRLLQADPGNALAWRSLAIAAEYRGQRAQANAIWQRAFEMSPYDSENRAGLSRTSLHAPNALTYNLASLATIYVQGQRWRHAVQTYRTLVGVDSRRIDFQILLAVTLWQARMQADAYALARHLVTGHPQMLMGWVVLHAVGDENDQALANNPITTMDPDGDFVRSVWRILVPDSPVSISIPQEDAQLLESYL